MKDLLLICSKNKIMKKAIIYYNSRKGTTKYFGEEIGDYLKAKGIETKVCSVLDAKPEQVNGVDYVFMGCWTHGLFIVLQHPPKPWIEFAKDLPDLKGKKIALFTTYKLAIGPLFKKMQNKLNGKIDPVSLTLKSKTDKLNDLNKQLIDKFLLD